MYEKSRTQLAIFNCELGVVFGPKAGSKELKQFIVGLLPLETVEPVKYNLDVDRPFIM